VRAGSIDAIAEIGSGYRREHWRHLIQVVRRESREFHLVGAERAAKYWAKRAARLAYRLSQIEE